MWCMSKLYAVMGISQVFKEFECLYTVAQRVWDLVLYIVINPQLSTVTFIKWERDIFQVT